MALKLLGYAFVPPDELWKNDASNTTKTSNSAEDEKKKEVDETKEKKRAIEKKELMESAIKIGNEMKKK